MVSDRECTCPRIQAGTATTEQRTLSTSCPIHGEEAREVEDRLFGRAPQQDAEPGEVGASFREWRVARNLSLRETAAMLGVTPTRLGEFERGVSGAEPVEGEAWEDIIIMVHQALATHFGGSYMEGVPPMMWNDLIRDRLTPRTPDAPPVEGDPWEITAEDRQALKRDYPGSASYEEIVEHVRDRLRARVPQRTVSRSAFWRAVNRAHREVFQAEPDQADTDFAKAVLVALGLQIEGEDDHA